MKRKGRFLIALLALALLLCIATITLAACDGGTQAQSHEHTFAEEWSHNDEYHWHAATCGHNGQMKDRAEHELVWATTTPASCDDDGVLTGTCVCGYSETKSIDAIGHEYTPSWDWDSDHSGATLVLTCENDSTHKLTASAQVTHRDETDGCGAYIIYTATASLLDETYTDTQRVDNGAAHQYQFSKWEWEDDYSSAVAVFVCQKDNSHVYKSDPVAPQKSEEEQPSCTTDGHIKYKATVEFEGQTYEDEQTQILPMSHTFEKWVNTQEPDCTNTGKKRQQCSVCGELYGNEEKVDALGHDFDTDWLYDDDEHWHKCYRCDTTDDHIAHTLNNDNECSICGFTNETPTSEFTFQSRTDNTWTITAYNGTRSNVVIPATYRGLNVTELGLRAFYNCTTIKSLVVPNTIRYLQADVFYGCSNIEAVTAPLNVFKLFDKDQLKKIKISSGTRIEVEQFKDYSQLESIELADTFTYIGKDAFAGTAWISKQIGDTYVGRVFYAYIGFMPENYALNLRDNTVYIVENACSGQINLTTIDIPDSVKAIGQDAFSDCTNITTASIPAFAIESISQAKENIAVLTIHSGKIGDNTFMNCEKLHTLTIGKGVTHIGNDAFKGCAGLTKVNITSLKAWCEIEFANNYSNPVASLSVPQLYLNEGELAGAIEIPTDVTKIGDYAFYNLKDITAVTIPDSVISIGENTFYGCINLTTATLPASAIDYIYKYRLITATITSGEIPKNAFYNETNLQTVTIGKGVQSIGDYAFYRCKGLHTVTIGDGVQSIGELAFYFCTGLQTLTIGDGVQSIAYQAFYGCESLLNISVNAQSIGRDAFGGCCDSQSITIGDNVQSIADSAFVGCISVSEITIPENVTKMGEEVFARCMGLKTAFINAKYIGYRAFYQCTVLQTVIIGEKTMDVNSEAFRDCENLKKIEIEQNNPYLKYEGFCIIRKSDNMLRHGFDYSVIPEGVTSIGDKAFYGCTGLISITIPNSVTSIGSEAFGDCKGLKEITIPENVASIGDQAFYYCTGLETVNWDATNCTKAGRNSYEIFCGCSQLTIVNIGENVQSIPPYAFRWYCKGLKEIFIPENVITIGYEAFYGCTGLQSVIIGEGVQSIDWHAFEGCTGLQKVYYEGTSDQWDDISIGYYNDNLENATRYYFSEQPNYDGKHWHWNEETHTPEVWAKQD